MATFPRLPNISLSIPAKTPLANRVLNRILKKMALLAALLPALCLSFGAIAQAQDGGEKVVLGYASSSTLLLVLLKDMGILESALAEKGIEVKWEEVPAGIPTLEAISAGAIDLGGDAPETISLYAQSMGLNFAYFLQEKISPEAAAIVVAKNSPYVYPHDLYNRRLAVAKASVAHYLAVSILKRVALTSGTDVMIDFLQPADAAAALESKTVDAWAVQDPFLASLEGSKEGSLERSAMVGSLEVRRLEVGLEANLRLFYHASPAFLEERPEIALIVANELKKIGKWAKDHPDEAADAQAKASGLDLEKAKIINSRRSFELSPVDLEAIAEQQAIANLFLHERILYRPLNVSEAQFWLTKVPPVAPEAPAIEAKEAQEAK